MAQLLKYLAQGPEFGLQNSHKKRREVMCTCNPSDSDMGEGQIREDLWLCLMGCSQSELTSQGGVIIRPMIHSGSN